MLSRFRFCYSSGAYVDVVAYDKITAYHNLPYGLAYTLNEPLFSFVRVLKETGLDVWEEV